MGGHLFRIEDIGEILFERSARAKRINISVRPFKGVRVAVPYRISFEKAMEFVDSRRGWIKKNLNKMRQMEKDHKILSMKFNDINRHESRKILVKRLDELAKAYGFRYNRVFIRNQKTRWGSCSSKNNISLNVKLVRLPERLTDYVIIHELVHTRIKSHNKKFYAELDQIVNDQKLLDQELKRYSAGLL
jgi:predicted metal-dependent hydrolase